MRKIVFICAIMLVIILNGSPVSAAAETPSNAETSLRESLDAIGLADAVVDMNVRIPVHHEQERLNNLRQPEVMPDVDLWGTLIRPAGEGPRPTILISTAYRREMCITIGASLVKHGYNLLAIDNRGTGSAGGSWTAFDPIEQYDTAFVIDNWIPTQSWSDGKVGMLGISYMAVIQFLAGGLVETDPVTGEPVHLKALFPMLPMSDPYRVIAAQGGIYEREFMIIWLSITGVLSILQPVIATDDPGAQAEAWEIWAAHMKNLGETVRWSMDSTHINYGDWFKLKTPALYFPVKPQKGWRYDNGTLIEEGKRIIPPKLPVFMVGGWFDIFTLGESECYQYGLANHAVGDKALVIGPWYHMTGAMGLGLKGLANTEVAARWFDWKIKGVADPFMTEYPVLLYVMGEDRWRAEKDWPLPESRLEQKTLFLTEQRPSKIAGDWFSDLNAALNYSLIEPELRSSFDYSDSSDPVLRHDPPILHGKNSRANARWAAGGNDASYDASLYNDGIDQDSQSPYEDERSDEFGVLTFTTEPLERDLEIVGPLTLTFWARTRFTRPLTQAIIDQTINMIQGMLNLDEAMLFDQRNKRDVQWIVELIDVLDNGRAKNITSGWLSAWHRPYDPLKPTATDPGYKPFNPFYYADTFDAETHPDFNPIQEDTVYRYVVELWPTCNVFKQGHRIRLSISNSDFPHLLPVLIPSENTIVLDKDHQARLDFTTTTASDEGTVWKWISGAKAKGSILDEFAAANAYLLPGKVPAEEPVTPEENLTPYATQNDDSSSSSCFIASATNI